MGSERNPQEAVRFPCGAKVHIPENSNPFEMRRGPLGSPSPCGRGQQRLMCHGRCASYASKMTAAGSLIPRGFTIVFSLSTSLLLFLPYVGGECFGPEATQAQRVALISMASQSDNRTPSVIACITVTTTAMVILVSLRVYVLLAIVRKFGSDDYAIVLATVVPLVFLSSSVFCLPTDCVAIKQICGLLTLSFDAMMVTQGLGKHVSALNAQQQLGVTTWGRLTELPTIIGTGLSKISIALLLLRLLDRAAASWQRYVLHAINVFVCLYTLIWIINNVTSCTPIKTQWRPDVPGTCRSRESIFMFAYMQGGLSYQDIAGQYDQLISSSLFSACCIPARLVAYGLVPKIADRPAYQSGDVFVDESRDCV